MLIAIFKKNNSRKRGNNENPSFFIANIITKKPYSQTFYTPGVQQIFSSDFDLNMPICLSAY
jgi:hypothetical protein